MIVDLVRNDLGRVAVTGTVRVPELLVVRRAPGRVAFGVDGVGAGSGRVADVGTAGRRLPARVCHRHTQTPCPATDFAVGIIVDVEYIAAQSVWRLPSPDVSSTSRSAPWSSTRGARPCWASGGGITADSDPDAEWAECLHKAAPVVGLPYRTSAASVG